VPDHDRVGEQAVAVRVVAVMMGVEQRADRGSAHGTNGLLQTDGAPLRGGGVDRAHVILCDDEAGVVDPPAAVRLHVGEDPVGDLVAGRRREVRMVVVVRGGGHDGQPSDAAPPFGEDSTTAGA